MRWLTIGNLVLFNRGSRFRFGAMFPSDVPPAIFPTARDADATLSMRTHGVQMADSLGRKVNYLRVSVTDRCNFRCTYCMPEQQAFLPRSDVLEITEFDELCSIMIALGVRKIRLTGGEPTLRRGFIDLVERLGRHLHSGALEELTLTTNGSRLAHLAAPLFAAGVRRINISLDTLNSSAFTRITRGGDLATVLKGIDAALTAGLSVKINTVALRRDNHGELPDLIMWAHRLGLDISLIETMPVGEIEADRRDQYLPLSAVRDELATRWRLTELPDRTAGPARYVRVEETGGRLGFITPLTNNFCGDCNRVRLTCTGRLFTCLGQTHSAELGEALRSGANLESIATLIRSTVYAKPAGHDFSIQDAHESSRIVRPMSMTGG